MSDELPGVSAFYRDEAGNVYHTYSTYARGAEMLIGTYAMLELTAKGRNEEKDMREWMRHHDRYEDAPAQSSCCAHEKS
jgi:predicted dithiol-disulfide oxidoreductase (DUF899 family)